MKEKSEETLPFNCEDVYQSYDINILRDNANQVKLEKLATATNNFHEANKLGQGGFGPVYKVMLVHLELCGVLF